MCARSRGRRWRTGSCWTIRRGSKAGTDGASWTRCWRRYRRSNAACRRPSKRGDVTTSLARRLAPVIAFVVLDVFMGGAQLSARASGEYRTVEAESLRITIDSEWGSRTAPGYLPVRFDIANLGEARVIEIVAEGTRFFRVMRSGPGAIRFRQAIRLARGDRVHLTVPIPISAESENLRFEICLLY